MAVKGRLISYDRDPAYTRGLSLYLAPILSRSALLVAGDLCGVLTMPLGVFIRPSGVLEGDRAKAVALLDEYLAISGEPGMRPLMERVLSRREILKA